MRLVLASASPRRADLLRAAGFDFDTVVVELDESVRRGEAASEYVRRLAMEKSALAMERLGPAARGSVVLGADTSVVIDGRILGKPRSGEEAAEMLRQLSGRWHEVMTGISLRHDAVEAGRVVATAVEFSPLAEGDIEWYLRSGEGMDKAGAYAVQGLASRFIPRIHGSYANVVGLPVAAVRELIAEIASNPLTGYSRQD